MATGDRALHDLAMQQRDVTVAGDRLTRRQTLAAGDRRAMALGGLLAGGGTSIDCVEATIRALSAVDLVGRRARTCTHGGRLPGRDCVSSRASRVRVRLVNARAADEHPLARHPLCNDADGVPVFTHEPVAVGDAPRRAGDAPPDEPCTATRSRSADRTGRRRSARSALPMRKLTLDGPRTTPGWWMYDCHDVYHQEAGVMRRVDIG